MELIINFWLSLSAKKRQNPCSGLPPVYQDLSTCHDWPVKKAIVNLPVRLKENLNSFAIYHYSVVVIVGDDFLKTLTVKILKQVFKYSCIIFMGQQCYKMKHDLV